ESNPQTMVPDRQSRESIRTLRAVHVHVLPTLAEAAGIGVPQLAQPDRRAGVPFVARGNAGAIIARMMRAGDPLAHLDETPRTKQTMTQTEREGRHSAAGWLSGSSRLCLGVGCSLGVFFKREPFAGTERV